MGFTDRNHSFQEIDELLQEKLAGSDAGIDPG